MANKQFKRYAHPDTCHITADDAHYLCVVCFRALRGIPSVSSTLGLDWCDEQVTKLHNCVLPPRRKLPFFPDIQTDVKNVHTAQCS